MAYPGMALIRDPNVTKSSNQHYCRGETEIGLLFAPGQFATASLPGNLTKRLGPQFWPDYEAAATRQRKGWPGQTTPSQTPPSERPALALGTEKAQERTGEWGSETA